LTRPFLLLIFIAAIAISVPAWATGPLLWSADTGTVALGDKAQVTKYLDDLKAHCVNGIWVQVEMYNDGAVNYTKTTLSGLPTAARFKTGQWADDDYLGYMISEAKKRGMQVMIKFHGSNHAAWDKNPDWRKLDSKGKEVLWSGTLKNFCVNSPYWEKMFFPMVKEIGQNYDVDGFYFDTCQAAYGNSDCCFCPYCKARFEKETGKKLPLKPVDSKNWTDPNVKLYAVKRVEWVNEFCEKYAKTAEEAKPGAIVLLNVSGGYNNYKDTSYSRHMGRYVTFMTPEPVNTPRMYSVVKNAQLVKEKKSPLPDVELAREDVVPDMDRFGYEQFMVKTTLADGAFKPVIPIARNWFTSPSQTMGSTELEISQIETAIHSGAKGWCFFGYLANALQTGKTKGTAWEDPEFIAYLKDLTGGPRSKWLADMRPDCRIGILYDREKSFWNADYWDQLKDIGGLFAFIQYQKKLSVALISTSEPDIPGFGKSGYKLTPEILSKFDLVVAPGLDYASSDDLQALKGYLDNRGKLLIFGAIAGHGKFLGQPAEDEAYRLLGITTASGPEPSGFLVQTAAHPAFVMPGRTLSNTNKPFRYNEDKYAVLSYKPKFGEGWKIMANEYTDSGKRPAFLYKSEAEADPSKSVIAYINSDGIRSFSYEVMAILSNLLVFVPARSDMIVPVLFSRDASVNAFASEDGMTRYFHILTPSGESKAMLRVRAAPDTFPIKAEIIVNGGDPKPITISLANRDPKESEMTVALRGNGILKLPAVPPGFVMLRIQYEKRQHPAK